MLLRSRAVEKLSQLKRVADRDTRAEQRIEVGDVGLVDDIQKETPETREEAQDRGDKYDEDEYTLDAAGIKNMDSFMVQMAQ